MIVVPVIFYDDDDTSPELAKLGIKPKEKQGFIDRPVYICTIDNFFAAIDDDDNPVTVIFSGGREYTTKCNVKEIVELIMKDNEVT